MDEALEMFFSEAVGPVLEAGRWLIGFSGGADSLALLELCRRLPGHPPLLAVHLNHGLRGAESDGDEAFCREYCRRFSIPFVCRKIDLPDMLRQQGGNLEDLARRERRRFFCALAGQIDTPGKVPTAEVSVLTAEWGAAQERGETVLLLAHHEDDQVETVLMRLLRGTGWRGLAGIAQDSRIPGDGPDSGGLRVFRPLLAVARARIKAYLTEQGLQGREDRTNRDFSYTRNRIRGLLLPQLQKKFPDCRQALLAAAAKAQEVEAYVCRQADALCLEHSREGVRILPPTSSELAQPAALKEQRLVQELRGVAICGWLRAIERATGCLRTSRHSDAGEEEPRLRKVNYRDVRRLLAGEAARANLCGNLRVQRDGGGLLVSRAGRDTEDGCPGGFLFQTVLVTLELDQLRLGPRSSWAGDYDFTFELVRLAGNLPERENPAVEYLEPAALRFPLVLRMPQPGERLRGIGLSPNKKISAILSDCKIPPAVRRTLPVLADEAGVLWLPGLRLAGRAACGAFAGEALRVTFSRK